MVFVGFKALREVFDGISYGFGPHITMIFNTL
jgi:hypothetical protein